MLAMRRATIFVVGLGAAECGGGKNRRKAR